MLKIVFYNPCQNGDVHVSRTYISDFVEKTKGRFDVYYAHKQSITSSFNLSDIPDLKREIIDDGKLYDMRNSTIFEENGIIYINTWYGQDDFKYFKQTNTTNCNFYSLYAIFTDVFARFGLKLEDFNFYLPKVKHKNLKTDFSQFLDRIQLFRASVLICSNDVVSGQAPNFSFSGIIKKLASKHKDVLFFSTNDIDEEDNIVNIKRLTLSEISYISLHTNIIVGRSSGAYTFSMTWENINDPNKTFVCFTNDRIIATGLNDGDYACKLVWSNDFSEENVFNKIDECL